MIFKIDRKARDNQKKCSCKPSCKLMEIDRQKHVNWASNSYRLAGKSNEFASLPQTCFSIWSQHTDTLGIINHYQSIGQTMVFGLRETHWRVGCKHVTLHGVPYRTIHIASFPKTNGTAGNDGAYSNNPRALSSS